MSFGVIGQKWIHHIFIKKKTNIFVYQDLIITHTVIFYKLTLLFHYIFNVLLKNQTKYFKIPVDWTIRTKLAKMHKLSQKLTSVFIKWILCTSNQWVNCIHCKDEIYFFFLRMMWTNFQFFQSYAKSFRFL